MPELRKKYLRILKIEFEDLREDIETVMANCTSQMEREEISRYVFLENMALFKTEILEIDKVARMLDDFNVEEYDTLDELIDDVEKRLRQRLKELGLPEAPMAMLRRKLEKVARYVRGDLE